MSEIKIVKCISAKTQCDQNNDCTQICYIDPLEPGQPKCDCEHGYRLQESDMKTCEGEFIAWLINYFGSIN